MMGFKLFLLALLVLVLCYLQVKRRWGQTRYSMSNDFSRVRAANHNNEGVRQ